jgi:predicted GNAT family N-acyltransferase
MIAIGQANSQRDIEECFRIRREVFVVEQGVPSDMERDEHDKTALHFLAVVGGESVGAARVILKNNGASAKIGRVAVCQPQRGLGIGKRLIAAVEASPTLRHVCEFVLDSQTRAMQFYVGLGYEAFGEEFMDAGIPHRRMKKANFRPSAT